jgi:hypothetical protein
LKNSVSRFRNVIGRWWCSVSTTVIAKGVLMDRSNVGIWVEMSTNIKGVFEGE